MKKGRLTVFALLIVVLTMTAMSVQAAPGNMAQFASASNSYIAATSSTELKTFSALTLEAWIKPNGGKEWALIMGKQYNASDSNPWYSYRFLAASASSSEKGFPRKVSFNIAPVSVGGEVGVASTTVVQNDVWTHVAGVYDGATMKIYINGTLEGTVSQTGNLRESDLPMYIGKAPWTNYNNYNGQMDELRIWNVARTQAQIQATMNYGLSGSYSLNGNQSGLVAYWPFNDTAGSSTADDKSQFNNVGTLYSGAAIVAGSTVPIGLSPDPFSFTAQTGAALNSVATSNTVTVSGISSATNISIVGGTYSVNGGAYVSTSGTVNNDDTVTLQQTASGTYSTMTTATLTIGGVGSDFNVTTSAEPTTPTVTTTTPSSITSTTASSGGNVTSDGGASVTARGVCWSTSADPTTSDSKTTDGTGTGTFTSSIMGLSPGTDYHLRAYATNSAGTAYGSDETFSTLPAISPGTYYVDILNGSDSNDGTQANPWKTLHHAISEINGGASGTYILIMAAGTYKIDDGGEADTAITLSQSNVAIIGAGDHTIGANSTTTTIDGTGATTWTKGIKITGSNVIIRGLSITKFLATGGYGIEISGGTENEVGNCKIFSNDTGIDITSSSAFKIRFCEIYENTTDGLNVTSSTDPDGEIYGNTIHTHQTTHNIGIGVFYCSPQIKRNKLYDNYTGIKVMGGSTASPDIRNNVIYRTSTGVMVHGIWVYADSGEASPTIYHNTIDNVSNWGIILYQGSSGVVQPLIKYNIVTNCQNYGIYCGSGVAAPDYNNVWGNGTNFEYCSAGDNNISHDPKYGSYTLQSDSPCINAIPTDEGDTTTMDYLGYKRPKGDGFDMGAYEYVGTQTDTYTLPGGTGLQTDYDIFTIPLSIGTGLDMRNKMEGTLGAYDPTHWRVFARTVSGDIEMNTQAFASLDIKPGMGFWGITLYTDTITYQGKLAPDAIYYRMELAPGWHLFAVPWPTTDINLGNIYVTDGKNEYAITNASNTLTEKYIWDYTGTGSTGYTVRSTTDFPLVAGTGYFIKVLGTKNIVLSIPPNNSSDPPNNNSASSLTAMRYGFPESVIPDDPEPPPLPTGSYGPVPDIRANGKSGAVTVSKETPVSITVSLDPGNQIDKDADWWVVAHTPFDRPFDWVSYVYPTGWQLGIDMCVQMPLFQLPPSFEVLNMALPAGDYTFYFAVDENADGIVDETWVDSVDVRVE